MAQRIADDSKREHFLKVAVDNSKMRYLAYRAFVTMLTGLELGKHRRYRLPACVVSAIRCSYPDPDSRYTGFISISSRDLLECI